jgi:hypothetical protein
MLRIMLGVWATAWFGGEAILSAVWPTFGTNQRAFQAAIEQGGPFSGDSSFFLTHVVLGSIASVIAGFLAALIAGENKRAPLILGFVLLAMGLLKLFMSWSEVPVWYSIVFTAMLLPMVIIGGKLKATNASTTANQ